MARVRKLALAGVLVLSASVVPVVSHMWRSTGATASTRAPEQTPRSSRIGGGRPRTRGSETMTIHGAVEGESTTLTKLAVRATLVTRRPAFRACLDAGGDWAPDPASTLPRASFVVDQDGTVVPTSLVIAPPLPDHVEACVRTFIGAAVFPSPGGAAARVDMPLRVFELARP